MFADDASNNERHFTILARGIQRSGIFWLFCCLIGVALFILPVVYLFMEMARIGARALDVGTFIMIGLGGVAGFFGAKGLRSNLLMILRPREHEVYRAVAGDGAQVHSFHGIKGARHAIKISIWRGGDYELPVAREDLVSMVAFLAMRCPNARR